MESSVRNMEAEAIKSRLVDQLHALQDIQKLQLLESLLESWITSEPSAATKAKEWHESYTTELSIERLKEDQGYEPGGLESAFGSLADVPQSLDTLINQLED